MKKIMAAFLCCLIGVSAAMAEEYVIDVPEGQVVSNTTANVNAVTAGDTLVKTGKGAYYTNKKIGDSRNFATVEIREGVLEYNGGSAYFKPTNIVVRAGALMKAMSESAFSNGGKPAVTVDEGGVFDCCNQGSGSFPVFHGKGVLRNLKGAATVPITGVMLADFTGRLEFGIDYTQTNCYIGDGTDPANDLDWSKIGSVYMGGGGQDTYNYPRLYVRNTAPLQIDTLISGQGQMAIYPPTVLTATRFGGVYLAVFNDVVLRNGRNQVSGSDNGGHINFSDPTNSKLTLDGGECWGRLTTWPRIPESLIRRGGGVMVRGTAGPDGLIVSNGAFIAISYPIQMLTTVTAGGVTGYYQGSWQVHGNATAANPCILRYDGGTLRFLLDGPMGYTTVTVVNTPTKARFVVGAKGMRIDSVGQSDNRPSALTFGEGLRFVSDPGTAGLLEYSVRATTNMNEPWEVAGPVRLADALFGIQNKTNLKAANGVFGSGELRLGEAYLSSAFPTGVPVKLGTASSVVLEGSSTIYVSENAAGDSWQLGPLSRTAGGALFLENSSTDAAAFTGVKSHVTISGTVATKANGNLTALPIAVMDKHGSQWGHVVWHATYDVEKGVVKCPSYTVGLAGGADAAAIVGHGTALEENAKAAVAGLCVSNTKMGDYVANNTTKTFDPASATSTLRLEEGSTLTVGDGTGAALVILNSNGDEAQATIKGPGELAFGGAEGVITCNMRGAGILSRITGTAGITYAAPEKTAEQQAGALVVGGGNDYSGGTRINGLSVRPQGSGAFGSGDVYVADGDNYGGNITFDAGLSDVNIANRLHAGGRGKVGAGALTFKGDAEWSGDIDITALTMRVCPNAGDALLSGVISGGGLQVYTSSTNTFDEEGNEIKAYAQRGRVILSGANVYTGKTEVIRTTLVLRDGGKTGPGEIELDDGVLEIEASDAVSLASPITGYGIVKLSGARARLVSFAAADETDPFLQQGHALDLNGRNRVVNSLKGFTSVKSSSAKQVHLSVLDDAEGSFAGEVAENVVLHYGKVYAPGLTLIVR